MKNKDNELCVWGTINHWVHAAEMKKILKGFCGFYLY